MVNKSKGLSRRWMGDGWRMINGDLRDVVAGDHHDRIYRRHCCSLGVGSAFNQQYIYII